MPGLAPILPPLGKAVRETLTPNCQTAFYTERRDRTDSTYIANIPMKRGQRYADIVGADPTVIELFPAGLYFCRENKPGDAATFGSSDKFVVWIWSTDFLAESQSNAEIGYGEEAIAYPGFTRVYTMRREVYEATIGITPLTPLVPLTALLSVAITAAGSGYTHATGAVGNATVEFVCAGPNAAVPGALLNAIVTIEGSGIASGAAITITGDGTGATATARIQPASAVLTAQKKLEFPADSPLALEFVRVIRVYTTLPGTETIKPSFESRTGAAMRITRQRVVATTLPTALDTTRTFNAVTFYCIDSYVDPVDTVVGELVTTWIVMPATIVEKKSVGYQFPAQFVFIGGWTIPPLCSTPGPYPGVTHTLTQQRTASKPATVTRSYTLAIPSVANTYQVTSPGSADKYFGIGSNTIHNAIFIDETCGAGTQTTEDLPASTPSSYTPGDVLLIQAGAIRWMGNIFEKTLVTIAE